MSEALKARTGLKPESPPPRKPAQWEDFALAPSMKALDYIEHMDWSMDRALAAVGFTGADGEKRLDDGLELWTRHVLAGYLREFPRHEPDVGGTVWVPERSDWVARTQLGQLDTRGVAEYEVHAWARFYRSADGRVNELRVLSNRMDRRQRSDSERAVLAYVAAVGGPAAEWIRVRDFACLEGRGDNILFDGTPDAAVAFYNGNGRAALRAAIDSSEYRPGDACVKCLFRRHCPALPRYAGLLGLHDKSRPRQTWSATSGRNYVFCPRKDHLLRLRLPVNRDVDRAAAPERGRAMQDYLNQRHGTDSIVPCTTNVPLDWCERPLPTKEVEDGWLMLRQHARVCPLLHNITDPRPEPRLVYDDTDADVLVLAVPDLLYRDGDSWVWRELKTTRSLSDDQYTLDGLPQIALAIILLNRRVLGGSRVRSRVELEILRPDRVDIRLYDPFDEQTVARATEIVLGFVKDWHIDTTFAARPGSGCRECEVVRWCSAGLSEVGQ
jgi:hypothetical protein